MEFSSGQLIRPDRPPLSQLSTGVTNSTKKKPSKQMQDYWLWNRMLLSKKTHCNHYTMEHCNRNNAELQQLWQPMKKGVINYPLPTRQGTENQVYPEKKHCSFCCSLLTPGLLKAFDFQTLDPSKNWYDVTISHESLKRGFQNYLFTTLPVWHRPHSSRPWKQLKYKNPLKYYWLKYTKGLDKI